MDAEFVNDYITKCIEAGKTSMTEICLQAQTEHDELEEQIRQIEMLRMRQNELRAVIRQLGGNDLVKKHKRASLVVNTDLSEDELDPYMKDVVIKICNYVANREAVTSRAVMDNMGSVQQNKAVYTAILWLLKQNILERIEEDGNRGLIKGSRWAERPQGEAS